MRTEVWKGELPRIEKINPSSSARKLNLDADVFGLEEFVDAIKAAFAP